MAGEIDEAWIEEAIDRHRRVDALRAEFDKAVAHTEVSVRSPDGAVEIVVTVAGTVVDVRITGAQRSNAELGRSVRAAIAAAADAATWAREKMYAEVFGEFRPLGSR
jgi:DNA-binding protein YbaB